MPHVEEPTFRQCLARVAYERHDAISIHKRDLDACRMCACAHPLRHCQRGIRMWHYCDVPLATACPCHQQADRFTQAAPQSGQLTWVTRIDDPTLAFRDHHPIAYLRDDISQPRLWDDRDRLGAVCVDASTTRTAERRHVLKPVSAEFRVQIVSLQMLAIRMNLNCAGTLTKEIDRERDHDRAFTEVMLGVTLTMVAPSLGRFSHRDVSILFLGF
jgi:hypothetical protein